MELSPSLEAASRSATQEFPHFLRNPMVYYRVYKSSPLIPILSQMNPVHISPFYPLRHTFRLSSHSRLVLPSALFPFGIPIKIWWHTYVVIFRVLMLYTLRSFIKGSFVSLVWSSFWTCTLTFRTVTLINSACLKISLRTSQWMIKHFVSTQLTAFTSTSVTECPLEVDSILSLACDPTLLEIAGRFCNKEAQDTDGCVDYFSKRSIEQIVIKFLR
jgi:hypothetical protein